MKKLFSLLTALALTLGSTKALAVTVTWSQFDGSTYKAKYPSTGMKIYYLTWLNTDLYMNMSFDEDNAGSYNGYVMPEPGEYTIDTYGSSGKRVSKYKASWYDDATTNSGYCSGYCYKFYSGTIYVKEGADGPYIYTTSNILATPNGSDAQYISLTIGTNATYRTVSVTENDNSMGTASYEIKSGYVYTKVDGTYVKHWKNGSVYTLTATETTGVFVEWQKNGYRISGEKEVDVTIDGNATYTAVFTAASGGTITVNAGSNGQVKLDNGSWGSTFSNTYGASGTATITAQANEDYLFYQWTDNASTTNTTNPYSFTVSGDNTYTASFKRAYIITTGVNNDDLGDVSITAPYRNGKYYDGQTITLTAILANDFTNFVKWQKNGEDVPNSTASMNVTVNADDEYVAFFDARPIETLIFTDATYILPGNFFQISATQGDYEFFFESWQTYLQQANFTESNISDTYLIYNETKLTFTNRNADIYNLQGDLWMYHAYLYNTIGTVYEVYAYFHAPISGDYSSDDNIGKSFDLYQITYEDNYYKIISAQQITSGSQFTDKYRAGIQIYLPNTDCRGIPSGTYPISGLGIDETAGSGYVISNALAGTYLHDYQTDGLLGGAWNYYWLLQSGTVEITNRNGVLFAYVNGQNSKGKNVSFSIASSEASTPATITLTTSEGGNGQILYVSDCGTETLPAARTSIQKFFSGNVITLKAIPDDSYEFWRWSDEDASVQTSAYGASRNVTVSGNLTLQAIFRVAGPVSSDITLCENCNDAHYNTFKTNYNNKKVNVTYNRQFAEGRWSTMCLPFSLDLAAMITHKLSGCVYEFKYATGNANVGSGVNLYFSNAKSIEAGKGYIVNADAKLAEKTSFVFSNVTVDVSKDLGEALNSKEAYDRLSNANGDGDKTKGDIELVGTLRNGTLIGSSTEGNTYMGLKENKIYYPNTSQGSTIWAYRGIFHSSKALDIKNMQKMRIIVDGEDRGELNIDADGELLNASGDTPSRKFIRDGVLYIEREGVIYDAQGKRVEN